MYPASLYRPTSEEFLRVAREIHSEREDLRTHFPDPLGVGFAKWLSVNGPIEYAERLADHYPPLASAELRQTSSGGEFEHNFLHTGLEDWETLADLWDIYGSGPFTELDSILDFGCGAGRMLRCAKIGLPDAKLLACDVRRAQVQWCREALGVNAIVNESAPPLPFETGSAQLTIALSLFSHFDAEASRAWMRELVRVTAPEGRILATTHGAFALAVVTRSEDHRNSLGLSDADARRDLRRLRGQGHLFHPLPDIPATDATDLATDYGNSFLTERWAEENWCGSGEASIVGHIPARFWFLQDVYVLKPNR